MTAEKPSVARAYVQALDFENEQKQDGYIEGHSKWDGNDYRVTWSRGHLVTLSYPDKYDAKYKRWVFNDLPFLPSQYKYEVIEGCSKQFNVIKKLYNDPKTDEIILAGDSGREGLYIQVLILMLAKDNGKAPKKVLWIDSQTNDEIHKGLSELKPLTAYDNLKKAGYMRAIEDYAFGLNFSRMLSCKFGRGFNAQIKSDKWKTISVGRVMTTVLGMVVAREQEIRNFKVTSFYKIFANCHNGKFEFSADWLIDKDSKYNNSPAIYDGKGFLKKEDAQKFLDQLNMSKKLTAIDVSDKTEKKKAPLLYNLAELQSDCSKRFKISPNDTLEIAQKLYEAKLTTYPRTDARVLSTAICKEIDKNLKGLQSHTTYDKTFVDRILTFSLYADIAKTSYCNDAKITDHYAIIPTGEGSTSGLTDLEMNVYQMIIDRFVCIFLPQAEYNTSTVILQAANSERFKIAEKALVKMGYLEVLKGKVEDADIDDAKLSDYVKKGDVFDADFASEEGKTTPPSRYTSGSMILAMESAGKLVEDEELRAQIKSCGIGTSATRAGILEKLVKIGYINLNKKNQVITSHPDGEAVYEIVKKTIPNFLSPTMTASWEKGLSQIEDGSTTQEFYKKTMEAEIHKVYDKLKEIPDEGGNSSGSIYNSEDTGLKCPFCGKPIVTIRTGFKCSGNVGKGKGCSFYLGEINGTKFTKDDLQSLISTGKTSIHTFKKKSGKGTYNAAIKLNMDKKTTEFDFSK